MYAPQIFQPDRAACLAFARARGFGTVCAWNGEKPVAAAVPFCIDYAADGTPLLAFHVARQNPLWKLGNGRTPWLMAVNGADAYVSSDWFASPDQVPTWLYQSVHLTGPAALMPDHEMAQHLDSLSAKFEATLAPKPPWTVAKLPAARREAMMKAIVGVTMRVDEVEGSFKLNQHKSDVDQCAVAIALARQSDPAAQAIAEQMVALRPQLDYNTGIVLAGGSDKGNL